MNAVQCSRPQCQQLRQKLSTLHMRHDGYTCLRRNVLWVKNTRSTLPTAADTYPCVSAVMWHAQRRVIARAAAAAAQSAAEAWVHCQLGML